jgi:surface carbohydrate biosynthesis protein (TIGR04326 family)
VQVTVKPHWRAHLPALPAGVRLADGAADLATLIAEADALYVSTITSAALDAVLAGLRVVQCLDPGSFDLSPLRGDARVATVRSGGELAEALERLAADPRPARDASDADADALLHLDPSIPRWRSLLDGAPA